MANLCDTAKRISRGTWRRLGSARGCRHQILEETVTDLLTLELQRKHPREVFVHTFTKPEEGKNGADWELWLTDRLRRRWLGIRFQAKIINFDTDRFRALHHEHQSVRLRQAASRVGAVPLYLLYLHVDRSQQHDFPCASPMEKRAVELFGCSLMSGAVKKELQRTKEDRLTAVKDLLRPFHRILCTTTAGDESSTSVTARWLELAGLLPPRTAAQSFLLGNAPPYVRLLINGDLVAGLNDVGPDSDLRRVLAVVSG